VVVQGGQVVAGMEVVVVERCMKMEGACGLGASGVLYRSPVVSHVHTSSATAGCCTGLLVGIWLQIHAVSLVHS
jgi:hypothetical protein